MTGVEHLVAHAPVLATEHNGHGLACLSRLGHTVDRFLEGQGVAFDAVVATGQADDELPVGDGLAQVIEALCRVEDVLRVMSDADHLPGVEGCRTDKAQFQKPGVGDRAHHAADIDRIGRLDQHHRDALEPLWRTPAVLERNRLIATANGIRVLPDRDGIYRSQIFPGLWVDGRALFALDSRRLIEVVQQGIASPEHAAFVKRLKAGQRKRSR